MHARTLHDVFFVADTDDQLSESIHHEDIHDTQWSFRRTYRQQGSTIEEHYRLKVTLDEVSPVVRCELTVYKPEHCSEIDSREKIFRTRRWFGPEAVFVTTQAAPEVSIGESAIQFPAQQPISHTLRRHDGSPEEYEPSDSSGEENNSGGSNSRLQQAAALNESCWEETQIEVPPNTMSHDKSPDYNSPIWMSVTIARDILNGYRDIMKKPSVVECLPALFGKRKRRPSTTTTTNIDSGANNGASGDEDVSDSVSLHGQWKRLKLDNAPCTELVRNTDKCTKGSVDGAKAAQTIGSNCAAFTLYCEDHKKLGPTSTDHPSGTNNKKESKTVEYRREYDTGRVAGRLVQFADGLYDVFGRFSFIFFTCIAVKSRSRRILAQLRDNDTSYMCRAIAALVEIALRLQLGEIPSDGGTVPIINVIKFQEWYLGHSFKKVCEVLRLENLKELAGNPPEICSETALRDVYDEVERRTRPSEELSHVTPSEEFIKSAAASLLSYLSLSKAASSSTRDIHNRLRRNFLEPDYSPSSLDIQELVAQLLKISVNKDKSQANSTALSQPVTVPVDAIQPQPLNWHSPVDSVSSEDEGTGQFPAPVDMILDAARLVEPRTTTVRENPNDSNGDSLGEIFQPRHTSRFCESYVRRNDGAPSPRPNDNYMPFNQPEDNLSLESVPAGFTSTPMMVLENRSYTAQGFADYDDTAVVYEETTEHLASTEHIAQTKLLHDGSLTRNNHTDNLAPADDLATTNPTSTEGHNIDWNFLGQLLESDEWTDFEWNPAADVQEQAQWQYS